MDDEAGGSRDGWSRDGHTDPAEWLARFLPDDAERPAVAGSGRPARRPSPVPAWPAPDGRLRVGWLTPTLGGGGAERWLALMVERLDRSTVQPVGIVTVERLNPDMDLAPRLAQHAPIGDGWASARSLANTADVLVTWGIPDVVGRLGAERRAKVVMVSHGPGTWTKRVTVGWRDADGLAAVSRSAAGGMEPEAASRATIIPNGVDEERVKARWSRDAVLNELSIDSSARVVLVVGRISPEKRYDLLPDAVAALPSSWVGLHVGGGWGEHDRLAREHAEAVAPGRVIYAGKREDVGDLLAAADVFLLPSDDEGQSLALIESLMAGLPVVCTPVGTAPEHPELVRLLPAKPTGEMIAAAILEDAASPETVARVERAKVLARSRWSAAAFGRAWTDYLLGMAVPRQASREIPESAESEPPLPGLARQAAGFAMSAARVLGSGMARADEATVAARLEICRACDHYRASDGRCGMATGCGCYVAKKAAYALTACPVGKWPGDPPPILNNPPYPTNPHHART